MNMLKNSLTDSKFHMWRACIAVIHLDREVTPEEKKWAEEKINFIPFNKDQKRILSQDLESGVNLSEIIPKITDKRDLAFLLHQIRTIGHMDGDYSQEEKSAFEKLEAAIMANLDLDSLQAQIEEMENESYHEDTVYKTHDKNIGVDRLVNRAMKFLNPGDYKLPDKE